jgi:hypothetical protein
MALAIWLAGSAAVFAQQFDRSAYNQLVDASAPDTIPPGTKITLQNWAEYEGFMPTWMQIAYGGKLHFHVGDTADYTVVVAPTGDYPMARIMK